MADPDTKSVPLSLKKKAMGDFFDAIIKKDELKVDSDPKAGARTYTKPEGDGEPGDLAGGIMKGKTKDGLDYRLAVGVVNGEKDGDKPKVSIDLKKGNQRFVAEYGTMDKDGRAVIDPSTVKYYEVNDKGERAKKPLSSEFNAQVASHFSTVTDALGAHPITQNNTLREDGKLRVGALKAPSPTSTV